MLGGTSRTFVAGLCCGAVLIGAVWAAASWLQPKPEDVKSRLSPYGLYMYDQCLAAKNGNTVACDAQTRVILRDVDKNALQKRAAELGAAGQSKREVVKSREGRVSPILRLARSRVFPFPIWKPENINLPMMTHDAPSPHDDCATASGAANLTPGVFHEAISRHACCGMYRNAGDNRSRAARPL